MERNVHTADIAKRIKEIRETQKISQEKMAELLDMTFSNYSKVENAYQNITIKHLRNICKILNVSSDLLLFGEFDKQKNLNYDDFLKWAKIFSNEEITNTIEKWKEVEVIKNLENK